MIMARDGEDYPNGVCVMTFDFDQEEGEKFPKNLKVTSLDVNIHADFDTYNMAIQKDCKRVAVVQKNKTLLFEVDIDCPPEFKDRIKA